MQDLATLVEQSRTLRELDISWNLLKPQSYINLIRSLGENRMLLSLNLSWNSIVDGKELVVDEFSPAPKQPLSARNLRQMMHNSRSPRSNKDAPWHEIEHRFSELSTQVVDSLCSLIKRNKRLQHVNLEGTGLSEYMLLQIANAISRAKSLVSIHLCSNPGTSQRLKDFI